MRKNMLSEEFINTLNKTIDKFEMYYKMNDVDLYKIGIDWDRVSEKSTYEPLYLVSIQKNDKVDVYLTYEEFRGGLNNNIPLFLVIKKKGIFKTSIVFHISTSVFKKFDMEDTDKLRAKILNLDIISKSIVNDVVFVENKYINAWFKKDTK